MLPCTACHRHVRPAATACPFCGAALLAAAAPRTPAAWALGLAVLAACGGKDGDSGTDTDKTTGSAASTSAGDTDPTTTTATPTTSGATSDASTGCGTACTDTSEGTGFIYGSPDTDGSAFECDVQLEDCPDGQKCMPWANDGTTQWNALKCVPIDPNPVAVGEPCDAPGGGINGLDNCDKHVMCFEVQGNTGICRAMCDGNSCDDGFNCFLANDAVLQLCLPACDVDMPDCPPAHTCLPVINGGVCAPGG